MAPTAIPRLDAASAGATSDTRSDTYGRGFRLGYSVKYRKQAYLSPDSLSEARRRTVPRQKWSGRLGLRYGLRRTYVSLLRTATHPTSHNLVI